LGRGNYSKPWTGIQNLLPNGGGKKQWRKKKKTRESLKERNSKTYAGSKLNGGGRKKTGRGEGEKIIVATFHRAIRKVNNPEGGGGHRKYWGIGLTIVRWVVSGGENGPEIQRLR